MNVAIVTASLGRSGRQDEPGSKDAISVDPEVATVRFNRLTAARGAVGALLVGCGAMLRQALVEHRHRRAEHALASLSDAILKDIGLHRSEIGSIIRFPEARRGRATAGRARPAKD